MSTTEIFLGQPARWLCRRCHFKDDRTVLFDLEARLQSRDERLSLESEIPRDAIVIVKRMPGQIFRPFACSQTEDQKIKAWINHVADTWRHEVREANRERMQGRRRRAIGIPSSMLRVAQTDNEKEHAMLGAGDVLVVKKDAGRAFNIFDHM